jgi:hypothetical protein
MLSRGNHRFYRKGLTLHSVFHCDLQGYKRSSRLPERVCSPAFKDHGALVWIGQAETRRLISVLKQTCHDLGVGGRQPANVVFANVCRGAIFYTMGSRYKWQPASKLLLSGTSIGEKKNFVWEEPCADLPQQCASVLGSGITGDEYLFRFSESKIESGGQSRNCFGV